MPLKVRSPRGRVWIIGVVCSVVAAGVTVGKLAADAPRWVGWMPQTVSVWSSVTVPIGMIASALAAWLVLPLRSVQMREQLAASPRSRPAVLLHAIVVPSGVAISAETLSLLAAGLWTIRIGGHASTAWPQVVVWFVGTVASCAAFAILGAVIAWYLKRLIAVVVAPALVYILIIAPMMISARPAWASLYASAGQPWIESVPTMLAAACRAALWVGVAALLVGVLIAHKGVYVVAAAVAAAAIVASTVEGPRMIDSAEATAIVCQAARPTVCTTGAFAAGLPTFAGYVHHGYAMLPASFQPGRVGTNRAAAGPDGVVFAPIGGVTSPTNLPDRDATVSALGELLFAAECDSAERYGTASALLIWWRMEHRIPVGKRVSPGGFVPAAVLPQQVYRRDVSAAKRLRTMSERQRDLWLTQHADAIKTCRLQPQDLP